MIGLTPVWFATTPLTGVRRQAACCVLSMRGSYSALGIFWARSFHHRPHPSLTIRRDRGQERAQSGIKKLNAEIGRRDRNRSGGLFLLFVTSSSIAVVLGVW